mmetsp:Transcript_24116/g.75640  ORF Transcript_24116/g.75640 Transcript_24116/m.75640 type:complete len:322 (-) Transcript_24116:97-1062(-)
MLRTLTTGASRGSAIMGLGRAMPTPANFSASADKACAADHWCVHAHCSSTSVPTHHRPPTRASSPLCRHNHHPFDDFVPFPPLLLDLGRDTVYNRGATVCWLTSSCTTSRSSRCAWTRPAAPFCSCAPQGGGGGARSPRPPSRTTSSPRCTCTSPTPLAPSRWPSSATSTQKPEPYPSTSSSPFSRQGGWRSLHPSPAPSASTWWTCMSSTTPGAGGLRSAGRNCAGTCTPRACPSPWSPTPPRSRVPRTSRARARPRASSRAPTKSSWWRPRRSRATPRRRRTTSSWRARGGGAWGTAGRSAAPPARSTRGCSTSSTPRV